MSQSRQEDHAGQNIQFDYDNVDMRRSKLLKLNGSKLITFQEAVKSLSMLFPHLSEYAIIEVLKAQASSELNEGIGDLITLAEKKSEPLAEINLTRDAISEAPEEPKNELDGIETVSEMNVKVTGNGWIKRSIHRVCLFFKFRKYSKPLTADENRQMIAPSKLNKFIY